MAFVCYSIRTSTRLKNKNIALYSKKYSKNIAFYSKKYSIEKYYTRSHVAFVWCDQQPVVVYWQTNPFQIEKKFSSLRDIKRVIAIPVNSHISMGILTRIASYFLVKITLDISQFTKKAITS